MFCTRVAVVCLVCLLLCKEECYSPVSFFEFWDEDYVSQLSYVSYYVGGKSSFQHLSTCTQTSTNRKSNHCNMMG